MPELFLRRWFAVLFLVCPIAVAAVFPTWSMDTLVAVHESSPWRWRSSELGGEFDELSAMSNFLSNRIKAKERLLDQLEIGSLSLKTTAEKYHEMDSLRPAGLGPLPQQPFPVQADSELEVSALYVLRHMKSRVENGTTLQREHYNRVKRDFESEFGHYPQGID